MAEAVGLAASLISLATVFDSVINCFEYLHFGKTFGPDFQDCLLKLDNARLRLSRWGEAVGLGQVDENTKSLNNTKISEEAIPQAEALLGAILEEMKRVEALDAKFRHGKGPDDASLRVLDVDTNLTSAGLSLHEKMRKMARARQNHLSLRQKLKWALFDRGPFNDMIKKIGENTKELQELFPAAQPTEKALVDKETLEFTDTLQMLKDAIKEQDSILVSALDTVLRPVAERVDNTVHGGNVGVMSAHRSDITQTFGR